VSFKILTIPLFDKQLKRLSNPSQGAEIKENCFKIRLAIKSKGKGKSGGGRVVTTIFKDGEIIYLLAIYDKSEKASISDKELEILL